MRYFVPFALLLMLPVAAMAQEPGAVPNAPDPAGPVLDQELQTASRAQLGVTMADNGQGKVWIRTILPNSAAARVGLWPNDQIVALDDHEVRTYLDVIRYVNNKGASDTVAVHIMRNGLPCMLTAALGSQYATPPSPNLETEFPGGLEREQSQVPRRRR